MYDLWSWRMSSSFFTTTFLHAASTFACTCVWFYEVFLVAFKINHISRKMCPHYPCVFTRGQTHRSPNGSFSKPQYASIRCLFRDFNHGDEIDVNF